MDKQRPQKLDLLRDCNDQQIPPREFMGIFCNRCRNSLCVNAGWSGGLWVDRMLTQADRLLENPQFADPNIEKFDPLRKLDFLEINESIVSRKKADPWSGPEVHLADPTKETASNQIVEDAVRALSVSRGGSRPETAPESRVAEVSPPPLPEPKPERRNPAYFQQEPPPPVQAEPPKQKSAPLLTERMINTPFPSGGVMIDGSPPPSSGTPTPGTAVDPWAAPAPSSSNSKSVKVAVGSKVKMGG